MAEDKDVRARLMGTWKLVGVEREMAQSGEKLDQGVEQTGFICYTDEPRMMVIIRRSEPGKPGQEITAYAGPWTIEGDALIHHVEMATREPWIGTRQVRHFRIEGNRLILTPPESPDYTHGAVTRRSLTWEKLS
jgi:hypothetical protein